MPHSFSRKRVLNKASVVEDMGFRKLYTCTKCNNLQTHLPTCMICYQQDTLVGLSQTLDIETNGGISTTS